MTKSQERRIRIQKENDEKLDFEIAMDAVCSSEQTKIILREIFTKGTLYAFNTVREYLEVQKYSTTDIGIDLNRFISEIVKDISTDGQ